ncbi:MAG: indolepyruvate oxidoreductase subunit beta [Methylocystaceae bacterium]
MSEVTNILITGVGGQGTLLTSRVIAQVALDMGYDVKVSEVHGMAQRGGSVVSEVRFGSKVYAPIIKLADADYLLAFEKLEAARYLPYLKEGGTLIINDERIDPLPVMSGETSYPSAIADEMLNKVSNSLLMPATKMAVECGDVRTANMVLMGALATAMQAPWEMVINAVKTKVPAKAVEVNLRAVELGRTFYLAR